MATLQQQVQQYLDNTGISLRELSRRSGVSHTTIGKILRGGTYKSDTAHALYSLISITPISEYVTLHDKVEQLAADRVDHDKGAWDVDLNCAKYRRVMQLEKELEQTKTEVDVWRDKAGQARKNAYALQNRLSDSAEVLAQREQHLKSCENALIEAHEKIAKQDAWTEIVDDARKELQRLLENANAEIKRLKDQIESLQDQSKALQLNSDEWLKECAELKTQLDHGQTEYSKLHNQLGETRTKYETQLEKAHQKDVKREDYLVKMVAKNTKQEARIMRLRVYVWILFAALVFVAASGFMVVWGAA